MILVVEIFMADTYPSDFANRKNQPRKGTCPEFEIVIPIGLLASFTLWNKAANVLAMCLSNQMTSWRRVITDAEFV